jgi:hypothetical protein
MLLFAQEYDPVVWVGLSLFMIIILCLDSDTIILKDLVPYTNQFTQSGKKYAFLKDHVNNDPKFLANWEDGL